MEEDRYGGLTSMLVQKVMAELGIEQKTVDKIQSIVDNVDIREDGDQTIIEIKLNNIKIIIDK
jgi:isopentenyldiphosphate isomerase